jgi:hypothetical protein
MKSSVAIVAMVLLFSTGCKKVIQIEDVLSPEALHSRAVGASAQELLSSSQYTSLKVEIQYMQGFAPDEAAIAHLQNFLNAYIHKPGGIAVVTKEIAPAASTIATIDDIVTIEKSKRTVFSTGNQIALYILYTNGTYTETNVLGIAYRNTSAVLFGKKIRDNSGGIGQPSRTKLEATVLEHEVAHLLGLVDMGTPMQTDHKDTAHGNHCTNSNCLMYYGAETSDALGFLVTGNIPALDANCIADLKANGGK